MVNSLQALVLYAVPLTVLFDMLQTLWHLPLKTVEKRLSSRTVPARYPRGVAGFGQDTAVGPPHRQTLDHEVHRRRMAGESYCFIFIARARVPSLIPFFLDS